MRKLGNYDWLVFIALLCGSLFNSAAAVGATDAGLGQLNLAQAISEGSGRSPRIDIARSASEEARWKKNEILQNFLPTVVLVGQDVTSQNYLLTPFALPGIGSVSAPQIIPTWTYTFSAQLSLFDGLVSTNNYQSAKSSQAAALSDFNWTQFKVEKDIALHFYRSLGSQILKEVAEQNLKTIEDHWRDVVAFKKAGVSTNYDVLRVEVQVSEAKTQLMDAEDNSVIAKQKLAETMGEESEPRALGGQLPVLGAELISNINLDSLKSRADLVALQQKKESLDYSETASSRFWAPKIGLFGNYIYYNNITEKFPDPNNFRDAYQVGVNLTWVLFDGLGSISRAHESAERRYQAERGLRMAHLAALNDFEMWKRKYLYYCSVYKSRVNDVEKSAESVRLAKEGHRVGARTNTDILDAESELFRARAGVVTAQIGAIEALINLELTTGQRLLK